jgi:Fungal Zn(2)-Cys(6) binuclear cluster domain
MAELASTKRACDRCHTVKERCRWDVGRPACQRCARLKHDCRLRRPLQKVGRKSRGRRLLTCSNNSDLSCYQNSTPSSSAGCCPSTISNSRKSIEELSSPSPRVQTQYSPPPDLAIFGRLPPLEQDVLRLCLGAQEAVGRFTIGPSFYSQHQRATLTQLYSAFSQLKDAFLSCAPVLASQHNVDLPETMEKFCYNKAATALTSLSTFKVRDRQDVSITLALGVATLTFALSMSDGGTSTLARHTLGLIKPYYEADIVLDPDEKSCMICLVLVETIGCLYRADLPTLRFECKEDDDSIDRYLGVSAPLLAQLYDLCDINHSLSRGDVHDMPSITARLDKVESAMHDWVPNPSPDFPKNYDHGEVVNILAQAKGLRLAILLIVHRLRCAYGCRDQEAAVLANVIFDELEVAAEITQHLVKCTDLCLMAASLEQTDERGRKRADD